MDESVLTAESEPQSISMEKPFLLCGTTVQDGSGLMLVTGVGMSTKWSHLMAVASDEDCEPPTSITLKGLTRFVFRFGLAWALFTFLVREVSVHLEHRKGHASENGAWKAEWLLSVFSPLPSQL